MEQKFDGTPRAEVQLTGRKVTRGTVKDDWGLLIRWLIRKNGEEVATPPARANDSYEHPDTTAGTYTIVLQSWKYVSYVKDAKGEFTASQFVDISDVVSYSI